jgi:hypothetical protein
MSVQKRNNNNPKSKKLWELLSGLSWLLLLEVNISFCKLGWKIEVKYQPIFDNKIFTELVENLKQTDELIK